MKSVGIICEFNPFHYGHRYYIDKIHELFPDYVVVCVMSGHFMERGDVSIINKWDKTSIALENGVDIVIELPFVFASQSADVFAHGALQLLNHMNVDGVVFGSEINDIDVLTNVALSQINNNSLIKKELKKGISFPKAMSNISSINVNTPNDLLGVSYIKEILLNNYNIKPFCIKRTSDYHSNETSKICSSSSIRKAILADNDISSLVPYDSKFINNRFIDDYFDLLKYKIVVEDDLSVYQTVDEGLENKIKKVILECNSLEELINKVKSKRYTYNRIKRMFVHILCGFKKTGVLDNEYIRLMGFNSLGQKYLASIKKNVSIPFVTSYKKGISSIFDLEYKTTCIYDYNLSSYEYKKKVIKK